MWKLLKVALLLGALMPAAAGALSTIDFDMYAHGDILAYDAPPAGLGGTPTPTTLGPLPFGIVDLESYELVAETLHARPTIAFDTTLSGTHEPDMEDPWSAGNLDPSTVLNRALIIQQDLSACDVNTLSCGGLLGPNTPTHGGRLRIEFRIAIDVLGFNIVDIDGNGEIPVSGALPAGLTFFLGDAQVGSFVSFADIFALQGDVELGNDSLNRIDPIAPAGAFDAVVIDLPGSFAIDNLAVPEALVIPEPRPALLLAAGLVALGLGRGSRCGSR